MRTRYSVEVFAAVWMLLATPVGAQPPQTGTELRPLAEQYVDARNGVSLADAIAQAIAREPSLRAARFEVEIARGMRVQAGLRPNPTLSFERREEPAGTDNQTMAQIEWPLDLFRQPMRVAVADREIEARERSLEDRIRHLIGEVRMRYGQAAAAVRDLAIVGNVAASTRRQFELLRQRVEGGASSPLERDLMEVELRLVEADRFLATGRADAAMFELKRTVGQPPDTPMMLRDSLETLAPPPLQDVGIAANGSLAVAAIAERPDVREAEARVQLAAARVAQARNAGRFDMSLFGSYMRMDAGFPQRGLNEQGGLERVRSVFNYFSAGAMVTIPLLNRNQGEIAVAQAEGAGAAARLEAAQLAAQAEVAAAEAQDTQTRRALAMIEGGVRLARQNLDVLRQTYELGRATVTDVLAEQRRYLDVERAYTETLNAAYEARTALQRARGER